MSISSVTEPQTLTPAYNDLFFMCESTNKNNDGFRYLADLYIGGVNTHSFRIVPTTNGYGKLNCSKLVSSYLSLQQLLDGSDYALGEDYSYVEIYVKWGEEYYSSDWSFNDYSSATSSNWTNYSDLSYNPDGLPKTMIYETSGTAPGYSTGDYIRVSQTSVNRTELEGVFRVLDVEDVNAGGIRYMVVLDLVWIGTGTSSSGDVNYANNDKTENLNQLTSSTIYAFNGAESFELFKDWDFRDWDGGDFLTNAPQPYPIRDGGSAFLQIYTSDTTNDAWGYRVAIGISGQNYQYSSNDKIMMVNASTSQVTGTLDDYEVYTLNNSQSQISNSFQFTIDDKCRNYEIEILFLDRMGSVLPFYFTYAKEDVDIEREQSKRDITTSTMYDYELYDAGEVYDLIKEGRTLTLETTRLSVEMATYFKELVSSGWTVLRIGDGDFIRVNVVTGSYRLKNEFEDGLKKYEIKVRYANRDIINW